jgi:cephalosporin hydroxylase
MDTSTIVEFKNRLREQYDIRLCQHSEEFANWLTMLEELKPRVGMEIGAGQGASSRAFIEFIPTIEKFICLDIQDKAEHYPGMVPIKRKLRIFPHPKAVYVKGDSIQLSTRREVVRVLGGEELDFLFIDGCHEFLNICADFWSYSPLVRKGGLVGFHDTQTSNINKNGYRKRIVNNYGAHEFWIKFSCAMKGKVSDIKAHYMGIGVYEVQ